MSGDGDGDGDGKRRQTCAECTVSATLSLEPRPSAPEFEKCDDLKPLLEATFPVPSRLLYELFVADHAPQSVVEIGWDLNGDWDWQLTRWHSQHQMPGGGVAREMRCRHPLPYFGPLFADSTRIHRASRFRWRNALAVSATTPDAAAAATTTSTSGAAIDSDEDLNCGGFTHLSTVLCPEAPYGDYYEAIDRFEVEDSGACSCRVKASAVFRFLKSTMFSGLIQTKGCEGIGRAYTKWAALIKQHLQTHPNDIQRFARKLLTESVALFERNAAALPPLKPEHFRAPLSAPATAASALSGSAKDALRKRLVARLSQALALAETFDDDLSTVAQCLYWLGVITLRMGEGEEKQAIEYFEKSIRAAENWTIKPPPATSAPATSNGSGGDSAAIASSAANGNDSKSDEKSAAPATASAGTTPPPTAVVTAIPRSAAEIAALNSTLSAQSADARGWLAVACERRGATQHAAEHVDELLATLALARNGTGDATSAAAVTPDAKVIALLRALHAADQKELNELSIGAAAKLSAADSVWAARLWAQKARLLVATAAPAGACDTALQCSRRHYARATDPTLSPAQSAEAMALLTAEAKALDGSKPAASPAATAAAPVSPPAAAAASASHVDGSLPGRRSAKYSVTSVEEVEEARLNRRLPLLVGTIAVIAATGLFVWFRGRNRSAK